MNDAKAFLDPSFRRETSATFADDFERTVRPRMDVGLPYGLRVNGFGCGMPENWSRRRDLHSRGVTSAVYKTAAVATEPRRQNGRASGYRALYSGLEDRRVSLNTYARKLESRAGIAPAFAVLQTAAWADRPTGSNAGGPYQSARDAFR